MVATIRRRKSKILFYVTLALIFSTFLFAAYSYSRNIWPVNLIRQLKNNSSITKNKGSHDKFGRLTSFPDKTEIKCPIQTKDTAVLLVMGQSNSANHADKLFTSKHSDKVFNYFDGKCYIAASPLLGATGEQGEFITPLADKLIDNGTYKSVVIISSGIQGTPVSRWQKGGDLNEMLLETIKRINTHYKITDIVWHQGERDFKNKTSAQEYLKSFQSLLNTLTDENIIAPFFISISTKCGPDSTWSTKNPVANGQKMLINNKDVFLGADTDALLLRSDRNQKDDCHFSESGQLKTAGAYAESIRKFHISYY